MCKKESIVSLWKSTRNLFLYSYLFSLINPKPSSPRNILIYLSISFPSFPFINTLIILESQSVFGTSQPSFIKPYSVLLDTRTQLVNSQIKQQQQQCPLKDVDMQKYLCRHVSPLILAFFLLFGKSVPGCTSEQVELMFNMNVSLHFY